MNKYISADIVFSKFSKGYMELEKDLPIRPSEMGVLNIISKRQGDYTPLMIAELLGVSKPMIAAHLQALIKKGYIYKEASLGDRRSFYVRPTEKGKILIDEFEAKQTEYLKTIETGLGEDAFTDLIRLLDKTQTILDGMKKV